jgi:hypothetical protein
MLRYRYIFSLVHHLLYWAHDFLQCKSTYSFVDTRKQDFPFSDNSCFLFGNLRFKFRLKDRLSILSCGFPQSLLLNSGVLHRDKALRYKPEGREFDPR